MIYYEIWINDDLAYEIGADDADQIEAALAKVAGDTASVLNVTGLSASHEKRDGFINWQSQMIEPGDEIRIVVVERNEQTASVADDSKYEKESTTFCSFCGKGNLEVKQLFSGNGALICNECIIFCSSVVDKNS